MRVDPSQKKLIFLVNPISGTRPKADLADLVNQTAERFQSQAIVLPTVASGDYSFVRQRIEEEGYTDVIVCGGDGTVNNVMSDLRDLDINFGIVPCGSGNGLAYCAGIPKNPQKAIELAFTGKARYIDAFLVNEQFACMLCGLGFDAKVAHDFAQQPGRGLLTYTQQTIKNYFTATTYHFEMVVEEHVIQTDAFFISVANSNQFGNQFTIAPKASLNDGLLDIVVVPKMNKAILPFALMQQVRTGELTGAHEEQTGTIQYFQTGKIQIRNRDLAPLHIDGEPRESLETLNIRVLPRCVQLIQSI
ncbi:diacylglycerol kinase family lipid kinase [Flavihumibacter cheonanensis]|uniref:diacylglycerol/lipid kinase family protein n=1 Tax=Flavihumibacter cheonanensis TaxID=1442385 RepID=UPI001EF93040|nr:YegS/Rv2252/BmrU family lipid kinase [Flavihumibacter cheonanensis]MCG7753155.1 YegS/Rv2252/BmrU family lipid kinase [Flavihumibacter cheonanensis]